MVKCKSCDAEETDSYLNAKCDVCETYLCVNCSSLSASEHKGVTVKKRSPCVKYTCKDCTKLKKGGSNEDLKSASASVAITVAELKSTCVKNGDKIGKTLKMVESNCQTIANFKAAINPLKDSYDKINNKIDALENTIKSQALIHGKLIGEGFTDSSSNVEKILDSIEAYNLKLQDHIEHNKGNKPIMNTSLEHGKVNVKDFNKKITDLDEKIDHLQKEFEKLKLTFSKYSSKNLQVTQNKKSEDNGDTPSTLKAKPSTSHGNLQLIPEDGDQPMLLVRRQQDSSTKPIYIGNLDPSMTKNDVQNYLSAKFVGMEYNIEKLNARSSDYASFRVDVPHDNFANVLDASNWPRDVTVKKFFRGSPRGSFGNNRGRFRRF